MLDAKKLIQKMELHSISFGLAEAYQSNLKIDYNLIKQAEIESNMTEYIWILRSNGTCLIPLYSGVNSLHVKAWNQEENEFFHVVGSAVNTINCDFAITLANEYPFNVSRVTSLELLVEKMDKLLMSPSIQSSAFDFVSSTTASNTWSQWREFFYQNENKMMSDFMDESIIQSKKLSKLRLVA